MSLTSRIKNFWLACFIASLSCHAWANFYQPDDAEQIALDKKNLEVAVIQFPSISKAVTTQQHHNEEILDQRACRRAFNLLAKYPSFKNSVYERNFSQDELIQEVRKTPVKNHRAIQDFKNRLPRLYVYFSFHGSIGVTSIAGIFCETSLGVRVYASEAIAIDSSSFALRKMLLVEFVSHIEFPVDGLSDGFTFGQIQRLYAESYSVYGLTKFRSEIDRLMLKNIAIHERELRKGAPSYTPEGHDELRRRIREYKKMLAK